MVALALVSAGPVYAQGGVPPSALDPKGPNGAAISSLFGVVLAIAVVVFVIVEGMLLFSAWRFRQRPNDTTEPKQVHGNTRFEIAWTIAPAIIVVVLFVLALQTQQTLDAKPAPLSDQLTVKVIGHQWWWEYQYPDLNITTATDLVIPVGKVVNLEISSVDVIHSFWIPQLNGKTDAFPNRINLSWIQADAAGVFYGQCAELCGPSHANIRSVVIAKDQVEFDAWVQQHGPVQTGSAAITGGGNLSARFVIHAVGPVWGSGNEEQKLSSAVKSALALAEMRQLKSISIPGISSGIFGGPKDICARVIIQAALDYVQQNPATSLQEVRFCNIDEATASAFVKAARQLH
jgi:cytochrome c oxidase subunit II